MIKPRQNFGKRNEALDERRCAISVKEEDQASHRAQSHTQRQPVRKDAQNRTGTTDISKWILVQKLEANADHAEQFCANDRWLEYRV